MKDLNYTIDEIKNNDILYKKFKYGLRYVQQYSKTGKQSFIADLMMESLKYMIPFIVLLFFAVFFWFFMFCSLVSRGIKRGLHRCKSVERRVK